MNQATAGLDAPTIFWGVLIVAAIVIAFMFLTGYNRDRYRGTKGGRVKRVIEYDDDEDEL